MPRYSTEKSDVAVIVPNGPRFATMPFLPTSG